MNSQSSSSPLSPPSRIVQLAILVSSSRETTVMGNGRSTAGKSCSSSNGIYSDVYGSLGLIISLHRTPQKVLSGQSRCRRKV
ncbi:hypothetical protein Tco_0360772 [Tanacetum coccineum]